MDDMNCIFHGFPWSNFTMVDEKNQKPQTKYGYLKREYHSTVCVALMVSPQNAFLSIS